MTSNSTLRISQRRAPTTRAAFLLVEVLVYLGLVFVVLGFGYAALYQCMDNSQALRWNADDIANALRAGERWRADVRAAGAPVQHEQTADGQILRLPGARGEVTYRFSGNAVFRSAAGGPPACLLNNVKASVMASEDRQGIVAWRWELELQTRQKQKRIGVWPLFTFLAVPAASSTK
jgi:hypothetical protein